MEDAQWCCVAFKGAFESAGERAFAVVVDRFLEGYAFILQLRALEPDDPGPLNHPRPISVFRISCFDILSDYVIRHSSFETL